tara:strand:+ start:181 stop:1653 length:1473 start_codon:yes stop_codon:yes gene_type:complete
MRYLRIIFTTFLFSILFGNSDLPALAVLDFDFQKNSNLEEYAPICTNAMISGFVKSQKYTVIERSELDKLLNEQKFSHTGLVDDETAQEIGKFLGAQYVHVGSISSLQQKLIITTKIIEVSTGVAKASEVFYSSKDIENLLQQLEIASKKLSNHNNEIDFTGSKGFEPQKIIESGLDKKNDLKDLGLIPIHRFYHKANKDHFYTKNPNPKGKWTNQGIEFYAYPEKVSGTVPIYRFYHKANKDHFYKKNPKPKGKWKAQGIEFYAYPNEKDGFVPIYRFYHKENKDHFYTKNPKPKGKWKAQGIEFYGMAEDDYKIKIALLKQSENFNKILLAQQENQQKDFDKYRRMKEDDEKRLREEFNQKIQKERLLTNLSIEERNEQERLLKQEFERKLKETMKDYDEKLDQETLARVKSEKRLELITKFGEKMGGLIFLNQVALDMSEEMVKYSLGEPDDIKLDEGLITTDKYYTYNFKYLIKFTNGKVTEIKEL